ncbi:peptidase C26 [Glycocaulis alkaliphilus]|uniref:Peptidase C26 n=1 Tax=Glycocaulis alkaliphilus TaxID=1434191 RepID=A0A3T0E6J5_9PROT|nr:gamma-glutamyl-gamma-aminobutyrate hydrolase family protein [Glycocaulis alkaliphilus]AZU02826.1 peptidase C26 [Glycocaulis alkaliphilus]GGB85001.1 peptidase C26 [Glycocaulis alkaliphilus]
MKPVIGYIGAPDGDRLVGALTSLIIRLSGGKPVRLRKPPGTQERRIDGLILLGGLDIHPSRYNAEIEVESQFDLQRDELELAWLDVAFERSIPVMGICRGLQMLNVKAGGDLHQRLDPEVTRNWPSGPVGYALFRKPVEVLPETFLARVFGPGPLRVNSLHRRAVRNVAPGFRAAACGEGGGVQAIEAQGDVLRFGVQFHPELLPHRKDMRRLFRRFVDACRTPQKTDN